MLYTEDALLLFAARKYLESTNPAIRDIANSQLKIGSSNHLIVGTLRQIPIPMVLVLSCSKVIDSISGDDNQNIVFTNIKIAGLNSNSVKHVGQYIIDLAQSNTCDKPVTFGSIGDFSICVRKDSLAGNNIFTFTAKGQY